MLWTHSMHQVHPVETVWGCGVGRWEKNSLRAQTGTAATLNVQLRVLMFSKSAALSKTAVFPPAAAMSACTAASHEKVSRAAGAWKVKMNVWLKYWSFYIELNIVDCCLNLIYQVAFVQSQFLIILQFLSSGCHQLKGLPAVLQGITHKLVQRCHPLPRQKSTCRALQIEVRLKKFAKTNKSMFTVFSDNRHLWGKVFGKV